MAVDAVVEVDELLEELHAVASIETTATEMAAHQTPLAEGRRVRGFLSIPGGYWPKIRIYGTSSYEGFPPAPMPVLANGPTDWDMAIGPAQVERASVIRRRPNRLPRYRPGSPSAEGRTARQIPGYGDRARR